MSTPVCTAPLHATCIAVDGRGILLCGPSGAGKSDLALRAICDDQTGATRLVADDRVILRTRAGSLLASAPQALAGRLEVRGVGIVEVPFLPTAPVRLMIQLKDPAAVPRLPELLPAPLCGLPTPCAVLWPFEPAAVHKLRLILDQALRRTAFPRTMAPAAASGQALRRQNMEQDP